MTALFIQITLYLACIQPPPSPEKKVIIFEGRGHLRTGYLEVCIKNILLTCLMYHDIKGTTKPNGLFQTGLLREFYVLQVKVKLRLNFFHLV